MCVYVLALAHLYFTDTHANRQTSYNARHIQIWYQILIAFGQVCNKTTKGHTKEHKISPFNDKGSVKQNTLCAWACPGHTVGQKLSPASTHIQNTLGSLPVVSILQAQGAALQTVAREVCHGM